MPTDARVTGYDAILFDFDGVLVDSEPVHWRCWSEVLAPFDADLSFETYCAECVGIADEALAQFLGSCCRPPITSDQVRLAYPRKQELFRDRMLAAPPMSRETIELVRALAPRFPMCVVTSSGRSEVEPVLEHLGILGCFRALVCGSEAPRLKPAPDPYLQAAKLLGSVRPLVVEDSAPGLASARAAGFEFVAVPSPSEMPRLVRERLAG